MSTPDVSARVMELLKRGIEAARAGDRAAARALLEQVVELDEHSEKGWFWLAAVTDDQREKRICLGNVVAINPQNERARTLLEHLGGPVAPETAPPPAAPAAVEIPQTAEVAPSPQPPPLPVQPGPQTVSLRTIYLVAGLGAVVVIAVILMLLSMGGGDEGGSQQARLDQTTLVSATIEPTDTPTPRPATWTPVPSVTPTPAVPPTLYPPPPIGLVGQIIMRSGQVPGDPDNQPIVTIKPDGTASRTLTPPNTRGHAPVLSPDGTQFAYVRYVPGTREFLIQLDTVLGTLPRIASVYWTGVPPLQFQDTPAWSPDGQWLAFTARGLGATTSDLYRLSLANPSGSPDALQRLTSDAAVESWPAFSPDARRIVYAADLGGLEGSVSTDLRIYDTTSGLIADLTRNGAALVEAAPDWAPDGQTIVFQAHEAGSADTDIYRVSVSGVSPPEKLIDSDAQDIQPRFSPDGRYVVFSSDRSGNWDVFIYELATGTLFQVTSGPETDIANDWGR